MKRALKKMIKAFFSKMPALNGQQTRPDIKKEKIVLPWSDYLSTFYLILETNKPKCGESGKSVYLEKLF